MSKRLTVALAGNPNAGKTTIFNNLTGSRQSVGNWPGVTVQKKEGEARFNGWEITIVDLPGIYSLTPYSMEEIVTRDFILDEKPDVVVSVIDAANLERNLYLATQIKELDTSVIFALNMVDRAHGRGITIDTKKLSELLDLPVVTMVADRNEGTDDLLAAIVSTSSSNKRGTDDSRKVWYGHEMEKSISKLAGYVRTKTKENIPYNLRWTAIKLLEDDRIVQERILKWAASHGAAILDQAAKERQRLFDLFQEDTSIIMTEQRYGFIAGLVREVQKTSSEDRRDISNKIDKVLTNRVLGIPLFFFLLWGMFQITFTLGAYPRGWLEGLVHWLGKFISGMMSPGIFEDMITHGVISGVGGVIVFLPNIIILFFCISLFEDTGYMARAAFLMDKLMHIIGLHGKSFIPLLMGFGCNVPAIMAARTLESEKDRILTILITPLISCSARLPVYVLLAGAFFPSQAGNIIFAIQVLGVALAIIMGRIFRTVFFRGEVAPFVMELPPYRIPTWKNLLFHTWDRGSLFLKKMGGVILIGSIVIWFLSSFPSFDLAQGTQKENFQDTPHYGSSSEIAKGLPQNDKIEHSYIGYLGKLLEPAFMPIGIDWRGTVALLTGFVAKELVVSTLGVLHAVEKTSHGRDAMRFALKNSSMTGASALSFMVFILIYVPCIATIAAIRRETGSLKWPLFSISYSVALAWIVSFAVYHGAIILGIQ
ncbi:MAG: ferrous iron transport protein B [Pseudomonadota bacterium]